MTKAQERDAAAVGGAGNSADNRSAELSEREQAAELGTGGSTDAIRRSAEDNNAAWQAFMERHPEAVPDTAKHAACGCLASSAKAPTPQVTVTVTPMPMRMGQMMAD